MGQRTAMVVMHHNEQTNKTNTRVLKNITAEPDYYNRGAHFVNVECIDVYEDL